MACALLGRIFGHRPAAVGRTRSAFEPIPDEVVRMISRFGAPVMVSRWCQLNRRFNRVASPVMPEAAKCHLLAMYPSLAVLGTDIARWRIAIRGCTSVNRAPRILMAPAPVAAFSSGIGTIFMALLNGQTLAAPNSSFQTLDGRSWAPRVAPGAAPADLPVAAAVVPEMPIAGRSSRAADRVTCMVSHGFGPTGLLFRGTTTGALHMWAPGQDRVTTVSAPPTETVASTAAVTAIAHAPSPSPELQDRVATVSAPPTETVASTAAVTAIAHAPSPSPELPDRIITGHADGRIIHWDLRPGAPPAPYELARDAKAQWVGCIRIQQATYRLFASSLDGIVVCIDLRTAAVDFTVPYGTSSRSKVPVFFVPIELWDNLLLVGGPGAVIKIWDTRPSVGAYRAVGTVAVEEPVPVATSVGSLLAPQSINCIRHFGNGLVAVGHDVGFGFFDYRPVLNRKMPIALDSRWFEGGVTSIELSEAGTLVHNTQSCAIGCFPLPRMDRSASADSFRGSRHRVPAATVWPLRR